MSESETDFMRLLEQTFEAIGYAAFVHKNNELSNYGTLGLTVRLVKDGFSNSYEYGVSLPLMYDEPKSTAKNVAFHIARKFDREKDMYVAQQAYNTLSFEARAAFASACQSPPLTLDKHEDKIAKELYESGLMTGYTHFASLTNTGYDLIPTSDAMYLYSSFKGQKP